MKPAGARHVGPTGPSPNMVAAPSARLSGADNVGCDAGLHRGVGTSLSCRLRLDNRPDRFAYAQPVTGGQDTLVVGKTHVAPKSIPTCSRPGLAHTRLLCKRLRTRFADLKIVVGRWGLKGNLEKNREQLLEAGADFVGTTLEETGNQVAQLLQFLRHQESPIPESPRNGRDLVAAGAAGPVKEMKAVE